MNKIIKTDRLEIKPYRNVDRADLAELLTNEQIKKTFMIPDFSCEEEIEKMVNKLLDYSLSDERFERGIFYNGKFIGFVNDVEIHNDIIELGYVISPAFQGQGFATEMLGAVIRLYGVSTYHNPTLRGFNLGIMAD